MPLRREVHVMDRETNTCHDSEPLVSVLCITYNQEPYIAQALESFLAQETSFPFEILVNDDCSTDGTADIALSYQERYPDRIQAITHDQNQYSQGNMPIECFLFPKARGRYLALCEGDDYFTDPTKLQRQFDVMEADPSLAGCVHANENVQASSGKRLSVKRFYERDCNVDPDDVITHVQCFSTNSIFVRRDAFAAYLQSPQRALAADGDQKVMTFMATYEGGLYYLDRIMSAYRFMAGSSVNRTSLMSDDMRAVAQRRHDARVTLLKTLDDATDGRFHDAVLRGIDRMDYEFCKDIRDYRQLRSHWPETFATESLPARIDSFLYTYTRPLHTLAYRIYCRL